MFEKLCSTKWKIRIMLCIAAVSIAFLAWLYLAPQPESMLYMIVDGQTIPHSEIMIGEVSPRYLLPPIVGLCISTITIAIYAAKNYKKKRDLNNKEVEDEKNN